MRSPGSAGFIREPIVIVAAPRSGSTLLFSMLSAHPDLWSLYTESNRLLEGPFHPAITGLRSNALAAGDLSETTKGWLERSFYARAGNLERIPLGRLMPIKGRGRVSVARAIALISRPWKRPPIRLVEKSPKNSLRIPFLRALFPGARFIHLTRDPRSNISSLMRGWTSDRHKTYPLPEGFRISGYEGDRWSFVLQPGWERLNGRSLAEICADQWRSCNEACLNDLDANDLRIRYEALVADPWSSLLEIATWGALDPQAFDRFRSRLPVVQTKTPPDAGKWLAHKDDIEQALGSIRGLTRSLGYE